MTEELPPQDEEAEEATQPLPDAELTPQQQFMADATALAYRGRVLGLNLAEVIPQIVKNLQD